MRRESTVLCMSSVCSCRHSRDEKAIKSLTAGEQQLAYTRLIRSQDPRYVNVWKFHGERTPCRVVSIRALEVYYGMKAPRMGSRLVIQALVRFDTLQVRLHLSPAPSRFSRFSTSVYRAWRPTPKRLVLASARRSLSLLSNTWCSRSVCGTTRHGSLGIVSTKAWSQDTAYLSTPN